MKVFIILAVIAAVTCSPVSQSVPEGSVADARGVLSESPKAPDVVQDVPVVVEAAEEPVKPQAPEPKQVKAEDTPVKPQEPTKTQPEAEGKPEVAKETKQDPKSDAEVKAPEKPDVKTPAEDPSKPDESNAKNAKNAEPTKSEAAKDADKSKTQAPAKSDTTPETKSEEKPMDKTENTPAPAKQDDKKPEVVEKDTVYPPQWMIDDCFAANMTLKYVVTYYNTSSKKVSSDVNFDINPSTAKMVGSKCGKDNIMFGLEMKNDAQTNLMFNFTRDPKTGIVTVSDVSGSFHATSSNLPYINKNDTKTYSLVNKSPGISINNATKYVCQHGDTKLSMFKNTTNEHQFMVVLDLTKMTVAPFLTSNGTWNGYPKDSTTCVDDTPPSDVVPIAVGCALAALVVIVLVAYLIGRRRSRARGYESM